MSAMLLTLLVLGSEPSLSDPDPAVRTKAVEAWARTNAPVRLPKLEVTDKDPACVEVTAPAPLTCERSVWLCPVSSGFGSCSGWGRTQWGAVFVDSASAPGAKTIYLATPDDTDDNLMVSFEEGLETTDECSAPRGFSVVGARSADERKRLEAELQRAQDEEVSRCEKRVSAENKRRAVVVTCEVLLVNPCRREAFTRCTGQNTKHFNGARLPVLGRVLRHTWQKRDASGP